MTECFVEGCNLCEYLRNVVDENVTQPLTLRYSCLKAFSNIVHHNNWEEELNALTLPHREKEQIRTAAKEVSRWCEIHNFILGVSALCWKKLLVWDSTHSKIDYGQTTRRILTYNTDPIQTWCLRFVYGLDQADQWDLLTHQQHGAIEQKLQTLYIMKLFVERLD